jgi:hypothetical protein
LARTDKDEEKGKGLYLISLKLMNEKTINPWIVSGAKVMKQPPSATDHL